jgi:hypothetical protein
MRNCLSAESSWLDTWRRYPDDEGDERFESAIRCLFRAVMPPWQTSMYISNLARDMLTRTYAPSSYQAARFWYRVGKFYFGDGRLQSAHEAFTMCERLLNPRDSKALYHLHTAWLQVAEALHYRVAAQQSCLTLLSLLERYRLTDTKEYSSMRGTRQELFAVA